MGVYTMPKIISRSTLFGDIHLRSTIERINTFFDWTEFRLPFLKRQILDSSELKEFADDSIKLNENGRKFFKRVENTVGKGEIARYEQFLFFPLSIFEKPVLQTHTQNKKGMFGKG